MVRINITVLLVLKVMMVNVIHVDIINMLKKALQKAGNAKNVL